MPNPGSTFGSPSTRIHGRLALKVQSPVVYFAVTGSEKIVVVISLP